MKDRNGRSVRIGDKVELWPDHVGRVVCSFDDGLFAPAYPEAEWGHLKSGALIKIDDGGLFHYEEPDEDFRILEETSHERAKATR